MRKARLMIVEDATAGQIINAAEQAMIERGHMVARYRTPADMMADRAALAAADAMLISSNFQYPREILAAPERLRAAIFCASGTGTIDIEAATELGIVVGHGATAETYESLAEATILMILALLYDLRQSEAILREHRPRPAKAYGRMLKGRTLGLVGFGKIARAVAERLQGWGVMVIAYMPRDPDPPLPAHVERVTLDELLLRSDVVSIHASLTRESRGLIDESRLRSMKPGAYLVNTARGGIVDEDALYRAAMERRIAGVGLDVFAIEPLPADSNLRLLPGALLTPHIFGHTIEGNESLDRTAIENLDRVLRGEPPLYIRNPGVLTRWLSRWAINPAGSG